MSVKASNWAWEANVGGLGLKCTLMHIADGCNSDSDLTWFSVNNMARRMNCNRKTVIRNCQILESLGAIELVRKGNHTGKTNVWRINYDYVSATKAEPEISDDLSNETILEALDNVVELEDSLVPKRDQTEPELVPKRDQAEPNLVPKRDQAEPNLVPSCHQVEPELVPSCHQDESDLVALCPELGAQWDQARGTVGPNKDLSIIKGKTRAREQEPSPPDLLDPAVEQYCTKVRDWLHDQHQLDPAKMAGPPRREILARWYRDGVSRETIKPILARIGKSAGMKITELEDPITYIDRALEQSPPPSPPGKKPGLAGKRTEQAKAEAKHQALSRADNFSRQTQALLAKNRAHAKQVDSCPDAKAAGQQALAQLRGLGLKSA